MYIWQPTKRIEIADPNKLFLMTEIEEDFNPPKTIEVKKTEYPNLFEIKVHDEVKEIVGTFNEGIYYNTGKSTNKKNNYKYERVG